MFACLGEEKWPCYQMKVVSACYISTCNNLFLFDVIIYFVLLFKGEAVSEESVSKFF